VTKAYMEAEKVTRKQRIDPRLAAAGWDVVPASSLLGSTRDHIAIEEFETANGPADYALFNEGRCIGVAEAKKLTLGPQGVLVQAERYAKAIDQMPRYQGESAPGCRGRRSVRKMKGRDLQQLRIPL